MPAAADLCQRKTVVVLGASPKPERPANRAVRELLARGYQVIPVHPLVRQIWGAETRRTLGEIHLPVHTLTLYVGPERGLQLAAAMIALQPQRVIMNPGTESSELQARLEAHGIEVIRACTLVLLRTGQF